MKRASGSVFPSDYAREKRYDVLMDEIAYLIQYDDVDVEHMWCEEVVDVIQGQGQQPTKRQRQGR